jgi:hypothetical protein
MLYAGQLSQIFAIAPGKLSVLFFYRRIFRGKTFHIATWFLIAIVSIWCIAFFFGNMLECIPISEAWVNAPGLENNPKCIKAISMYLALVYSDLVIDVLILIVPIPLGKSPLAHTGRIGLISVGSLESSNGYEAEDRRIGHILAWIDVRLCP